MLTLTFSIKIDKFFNFNKIYHWHRRIIPQIVYHMSFKLIKHYN